MAKTPTDLHGLSTSGSAPLEENQYSRRALVKSLTAAAALLPLAAHSLPTSKARAGARKAAAKTKEHFGNANLVSQRLGGMLAERMNVNLQYGLLGVDPKVLLAPFKNRPREPVAAEPMLDYTGEYVGKFLEAASMWLSYEPNDQLRSLTANVARELISTQDADGYLGTFAPNRRWQGWDVWVNKYNMMGLLRYYEVSGDQPALECAKRIGDLLITTFGEQSGQRDITFNARIAPDVISGSVGGVESTVVLEPFSKLYGFTGEGRYLEFAKYVAGAFSRLEARKEGESPIDDASIPRGKAHEMMSNFVGLLELYRITGDSTWLKMVLRGWDDIQRTQLYLTGAVSTHENFQPAGRLLSLQSSSVGETCATVSWLELNLSLLRLTGEARYGQEIERAVYNHLLAAQDTSSGKFTYYTSFTGKKDVLQQINCCMFSGKRGLSLVPQLVWGVDDTAFVMNLYCQGRTAFEMSGVPVHLECHTEFPLQGDVLLTVTPQRATSFTLRLRVPEWADHFEVSDGTRTTVGVPGTMLDLTRVWSPKNTIRIQIGLPIKAVSGAPTYPNYVALRRGPQILTLEKRLNPQVKFLHRCAVASSNGTLRSANAALPDDWAGRQGYSVDGFTGVPQPGADQLNRESTQLVFVPFADSVDHRVWVLAPDRFRTDVPAVTAFARALVWPDKIRPGITAVESITDESPQSFCTVDPRNYGVRSIIKRELGRRSEPVSFVVTLDAPATLSRIVFRHAPASNNEGQFQKGEKPRVQVLKTGALNIYAVDDAAWEDVAVIDPYLPSERGLFDIRLDRAVAVTAIRVVGRPAGDYVTCAELSGYG